VLLTQAPTLRLLRAGTHTNARTGAAVCVVQGRVPLGRMALDRLEVVPWDDVPPSTRSLNFPHPYRLCVRYLANATGTDTFEEELEDRDFLLCSEEPVDDWIRWIKLLKGARPV
jgi:hypothetical protein